MARDGCNCYFSFWVIFCPFTPLTAQKMKIKKKWKKARRYHNLTRVYQKLWSDDVQFLRYGARQTTDFKSDILRWVPHLKNLKHKISEINLSNEFFRINAKIGYNKSFWLSEVYSEEPSQTSKAQLFTN